MNVTQQNKDDKVHKILLVDDDSHVIDALYSTLHETKQFNSEISIASNSKTALDLLEKQEFDLILTDYKMPGMDGIELLNHVKKIYPNTYRILITGYPDVNVTKDAINCAEVHHFIEKPWSMETLLSAIHMTLEKKNEKVTKSSSEVNNVNEALRIVIEEQKKLSKTQSKMNKKPLMLEFCSQAEFNKFFFKIKNMKNVSIDDIHIFENKYILKLNVYRSSYVKIK